MLNGQVCCVISQKNWFDFNLMSGSTSLISAQNGGGKSSFLEIVCIIFGKQFQPEMRKGNSHALISKGKNPSDPSYTCIHVCVDSTTYRIARVFDNDGKTKQRGGGVYTKDGNTWKVVCRDSPKTKEWVAKHMGNIHDLLMTTLVSQSNDDDFLSMKPHEQRTHLEQLLGMKTATAKATLFKHAFLIFKSFKSNLDVYCTCPEDTAHYDEDKLCAIHAIYENKKLILNTFLKKQILFHGV